MAMTTAAHPAPSRSLFTRIIGEREPLTVKRVLEGAALILGSLALAGLCLLGAVFAQGGLS
jgi:hypothetical protein